MVERISCKPSNPSGQLEVLKVDFTLKINSKQNPNFFLAWNLLNDIRSVMDYARHNLVFSSGKMSRNFTNSFMTTDDSDSVEAISSFFLSNSILFFNSSFDYLWIFLRISYSSHEDFTSVFSKNIIEKKIKNELIQKDDWQKGLFEMISNIKYRERKKWIIENKEITEMMKKKICQITYINNALKRKYQANDIKHGRFPYFLRSNPQNGSGIKFKLAMEQFYSKSGGTGITFGIPQTGLNIDDVQKFLIEYNNRTVELIYLIIEEKLGLNGDFAV